MKTVILASILSLGIGGVAISTGSGKCCGHCKTATTQTSAPINTKCPVEHEAIDPKITYVYEGKTIGFCCASCIDTFKKDPAKYLKDLK